MIGVDCPGRLHVPCDSPSASSLQQWFIQAIVVNYRLGMIYTVQRDCLVFSRRAGSMHVWSAARAPGTFGQQSNIRHPHICRTSIKAVILMPNLPHLVVSQLHPEINSSRLLLVHQGYVPTPCKKKICAKNLPFPSKTPRCRIFLSLFFHLPAASPLSSSKLPWTREDLSVYETCQLHSAVLGKPTVTITIMNFFDSIKFYCVFLCVFYFCVVKRISNLASFLRQNKARSHSKTIITIIVDIRKKFEK